MPSVAELLEKVDAAAVLGRYTQLKKASSGLKGLCPLHEEKTPSFSVDPFRGLWYCFGCGQGGNLLTFIERKENLPFPESAQFLAKLSGVSWSPGKGASGQRQKLYDALSCAARFYHRQLLEEGGASARRYLKERGIHRETVEAYQLGFSSPGASLFSYLRKKGFSDEILRISGLLCQRQGRWIDPMTGRLVVPVHDLLGRTVGFAGRSLDGAQPKYYNTPESVLFRKGEILYGLFQAKPAVEKEGTAVIVEGYFDVMQLHQHGVENVVACMGTSLTEAQLKLLNRFATRCFISFDGDAAGARAQARLVDTFLRANLDARLVRLEGADPDSFVRRHGAAGLRERLFRAEPLHRFFLMNLKEKHDLGSLAGRRRAREEMEVFLGGLSDEMARAEACAVARELGIPIRNLRRETHKGEGESRARGGTSPRTLQGRERLEGAVVPLLLEPQALSIIVDELTPDDFAIKEVRELVKAAFGLYRAGLPVTQATLAEGASAEAVGFLGLAVCGLAAVQDPDQAVADARDTCRRLVELRERRRAREIQGALRQRFAAGDLEGARKLQSLYRQTREKIWQTAGPR